MVRHRNPSTSVDLLKGAPSMIQFRLRCLTAGLLYLMLTLMIASAPVISGCKSGSDSREVLSALKIKARVSVPKDARFIHGIHRDRFVGRVYCKLQLSSSDLCEFLGKPPISDLDWTAPRKAFLAVVSIAEDRRAIERCNSYRVGFGSPNRDVLCVFVDMSDSQIHSVYIYWGRD